MPSSHHDRGHRRDKRPGPVPGACFPPPMYRNICFNHTQPKRYSCPRRNTIASLILSRMSTASSRVTYLLKVHNVPQTSSSASDTRHGLGRDRQTGGRTDKPTAQDENVAPLPQITPTASCRIHASHCPSLSLTITITITPSRYQDYFNKRTCHQSQAKQDTTHLPSSTTSRCSSTAHTSHRVRSNHPPRPTKKVEPIHTECWVLARRATAEKSAVIHDTRPRQARQLKAKTADQLLHEPQTSA